MMCGFRNFFRWGFKGYFSLLGWDGGGFEIYFFGKFYKIFERGVGGFFKV